MALNLSLDAGTQRTLARNCRCLLLAEAVVLGGALHAVDR